MPVFIEVALNVPLDQTFTYTVPANSPVAADLGEKELSAAFFGRRAEVRFGNRKMTGFVVGASHSLPPACPVGMEKIRPAVRFIDNEAVLTPELYATARWMAAYYLSPIGETIAAMVPSGRRESDAAGFSFEEDETSFERRRLSEEQLHAVDGILDPQEKRRYHYLYGVTGSGKTEVFLTAAEKVMAQGKGVIYLVPEIGLTPQVTEAVVRRFGNTAAVLHSALTPSQRLGEWKRILSKEARVVIGARSAVFAPVPDLGLIIIDEEHDASYKSGSSPRYHARQVAMYRAAAHAVPLVMGSATPSVEAWHLMQSGTIVRHTLSRRLAGGARPEIRCINLSLEKDGGSSLSAALTDEMRQTLQQKRQIILFLNRRGFTHFFRCNSCGYELTCRNCSVSLTYHKNENRLRCHYCGYSVEPPKLCPQCGSLDVGYSGFGTEYIENEVKAKFPNARVMRIDTDSLRHKGELQEKISAFRNGEYDIMLGTQMVAKGLNFPKLQLVGVVLADTSLHLPDFRAAERTFSLITQVAGRAGRFFPDGKVIVQSYSPDREPVAFAIRSDTEGFYQAELAHREQLCFPPYTRLLRLVFRSAVPGAAEQAAEGAYSILRTVQEAGTEILGPAECPLEMVAANHRQQILLRGKSITALQHMAARLVHGYTAPRDVYIEVDVDPVNML